MAGAGDARKLGGVAAVLAVLALALQLAIPAGFMLSAGADGPAIVICTGHGPLLAPAGDHGRPSKTPASKPGACPFAGHGGAPTFAQARLALPVRFEAVRIAAMVRFDLAPGRGLAAPPPPSHAPPVLST